MNETVRTASYSRHAQNPRKDEGYEFYTAPLEIRKCRCGTHLRRGNPGPLCTLCQSKQDVGLIEFYVGPRIYGPGECKRCGKPRNPLSKRLCDTCLDYQASRRQRNGRAVGRPRIPRAA